MENKGTVIRPLQAREWALLMWQKFQCRGCKACADLASCRSLTAKIRKQRRGGRLKYPLEGREWDVYLKWQGVCADRGNDCVSCSLKAECCGKERSVMDWVEQLNRNFYVGVLDVAINSAAENPCVTGCHVPLRSGPVSALNCVGCAALGTGSWRMKGEKR